VCLLPFSPDRSAKARRSQKTSSESAAQKFLELKNGPRRTRPPLPLKEQAVFQITEVGLPNSLIFQAMFFIRNELLDPYLCLVSRTASCNLISQWRESGATLAFPDFRKSASERSNRVDDVIGLDFPPQIECTLAGENVDLAHLGEGKSL